MARRSIIFEASALGTVDRIEEILARRPAAGIGVCARWIYAGRARGLLRPADAARALIAAGADVHAPARNAFKVQALHAAVAGRNLDIVKAVLEAGADPNAQQQAGFRPMHEAGTNANRALAELLLAHGADPLLPADSGKNAIDLAREKGHMDFASWLEQQTR